MAYFLQLLAQGVHTGALYALLAYGYVLVNGLTRQTDLSFGAIFAFSGQSFILATGFGWTVLWMTVPAALAFAAALILIAMIGLALIVDRYLYLPLSGNRSNAILVATLGLALVLTELARIAAQSRDFWLPPVLSSPLTIGGLLPTVTLTGMQLVDIAVAVIVIGIGQIVLLQTSAGRIWRAVSDDAGAAEFCGVDGARVRAIALIAGYAIVSLAGILAALYYGNISFSTGLVFGLKILFVTAVGGFQVPLQAALGAVVIGILDVLWKGYFSLLWSDAAVFILLVFLLVVRKPEPLARPSL